MEEENNVRVLGRVRPLNDNERQTCLTSDLNSGTITLQCKPASKTFTLDGVLGSEGSQMEVFEFAGKPITMK